MGLHDDRRTTLDPGRTALALRAKGKAAGGYPFVEEAARPRGGWLARLRAWLGGRRDPSGSRPEPPTPPSV
jgi:hypothetical protein